MKLLIVDDSSLIRETILEAYRGSIFTDIQTASDGLLAVTAFKKHMPDIVTLDITMPHMDGLAALGKMLEIKSNTKVLVISALADHHTAIESLTYGADQFICKPFTNDDLKEALDDIIEEANSEVNDYEIRHYSSANLLNTIDSITTEQRRKTSEVRPSIINYPSGFVEPPKVSV